MAEWIVSGSYGMKVDADTAEEAIEYACDKIGNGWNWEAEEVQSSASFMVKRFYRDEASADLNGTVVMRGLTQRQAQEHCNDPETSSSTCTTAEAVARTEAHGPWFDGWTEE